MAFYKETIRIGSRGSKLALRQTEWVKERLSRLFPSLSFEIVVIKTRGDKVTDVPLAHIGGKGLFVKEIEEALLRGEIDMAVHSMKDVPTELPQGLRIAAVPEREDPRDVLISRNGLSFDRLADGARIGTSSLRRKAQLLHLNPRWRVEPLRGNLDTRIRKLHTEGLDAILVAAAGIRRMGLEERVTEYISPDLILPAAGQGALGIEVREDAGMDELLLPLNHPPTAVAVEAERAFLRHLGGGCQVPIAAYGEWINGKVRLKGLIFSPDGERSFWGEEEGGDPEEVGRKLAQRLLKEGGEKILKEIYGNSKEEGG